MFLKIIKQTNKFFKIEKKEIKFKKQKKEPPSGTH